MKKNDELLNDINIDLETADRVAKEYPSLSDSAKERMFKMTKEKMNNTNIDNTENENSVHGVEIYNRPGWIKIAGMAAAFVLIAGGIGGGSYLLHNMKSTAPSPSSSLMTEVTTYTSETVTTEAASGETKTTTATMKAVAGTATENTSITTTAITTAAAAAETTAAQTENETFVPDEAAHKLTDNYWDYAYLFGRSVLQTADYEHTVHVKFETPDNTSGDPMNIEYVKCMFKELADRNMEELKEYYYSYYTADFDPFYDPYNQYPDDFELFGPSFTEGSDMTMDHNCVYIEYNGELYQRSLYTSFDNTDHWTDDQMDITNVTDKSFTLKRKFRNRPNAMNGDVRGEVTFSIVFDENAQDWRIDKTEYTYSQN